MMIIGIHHANISIPSGQEDVARAFYADLLGLQEIEKPQALQANGGLWFTLGNMDLHIGIQDNIDRASLKIHLAYQVDNLQAWRNHLSDAGIAIKENTAIPDFDRFEIRDPFGNRIEFVQLRSE
ncbi:MAG: VOC family protein [Phototrophicaceae bacterium]